MRGSRHGTVRAGRFRGTALMALLVLFSSVPRVFPEAFSFLPVKEAQRARRIQTALDASLEAWIAVESRYATELGTARRAVSGIGDSEKIRSLLESRRDGSWKPGSGSGPARIQADALEQARLLASILEPRIDKLGREALTEVYRNLMDRARRVPGMAAEYLEFTERVASVDTAGLRFAVRALMNVSPEIVALRLAPDDLTRTPYADFPELAEEAERIRRIRAALEELRQAMPALVVPELEWTASDAAAVERSARALSLLEPGSRARLLESLDFPGSRILPAFLAGLSPEERGLWARSRGISGRSATVFLSCAPAAGLAAPLGPASTLPTTTRSVAVSLAELERESAKGAAGSALVSRLKEPALRSFLRSEAAPARLRTTVSEARDRLIADLQTELARGAPASEPVIEVEETPGLAGFTVVRAFTAGADGTLARIPPEVVRNALDRIAARVSGEAGRTGSGIELGFIAAPVSSVPRNGSWAPFFEVSGLSPAATASVCSYILEDFRSAARSSGLAPAYLLPSALSEFAAVCEARCLGRIEDSQVMLSLEGIGGWNRLQGLWEEAEFNLESALRAIGAYLEGDLNP